MSDGNAGLRGRNAVELPRRSRRPFGYYLLAGLLLFQGVSGLVGGYGLVSDPSGESLGIPIEWLQGTPFSSYLIPGLILLIVLGVFPLVVLTCAWWDVRVPALENLERESGQRWTWWASLLVGVALVVWIVVQGLMIGFGAPLQYVYLALGVVITVVALLRSVRQALSVAS